MKLLLSFFFVFAVKAIVAAEDKTNECPPGWKFFELTSSCYYLTDVGTSQLNEERCLKMGAHLTSIHSEEEHNFIEKTYNNGKSNGIGLKLINQKWKWSDGTNVNYFKLNTINSEVLNNSCVVIKNGAWNVDDRCTPTTGICKKSARCPTGWIFVESTSSCYLYIRPLQTWDEAEEQCREKLSHLVSIHSDEEASEVNDIVMTQYDVKPSTNYAFWIGYHWKNEEWQWSDGSPANYSESLYMEGPSLCAYQNFSTDLVNVWWNWFTYKTCDYKRSSMCKMSAT